jgi:outer membrane protein assembly factor BamB
VNASRVAFVVGRPSVDRAAPKRGFATFSWHDDAVRKAVLFGSMCLFALGCEGIIGANFDRSAADAGAASGDEGGEGAEGDGSTRVDSSSEPAVDGGNAHDAASDSGPGSAAACGDMSPYDPGSPWPMGAYCPTRPNRTNVAALQTPHLLWRYDYASPSSGLEFTSGPAIAADGTVLTSAYLGYDGGFLNAVIGVKNKVEVFRAMLPQSTCNTPTIDKLGNFYVHCANVLAAFTKAGAPLWTLPLATAATDMPVILGDGTIVVLDGPQMVFVSSAGAKKNAYALGEAGLIPSFTGSIAVSPSGVLYAAAAPKPGDLNGSLHAVDSSAQMVAAPVTLDQSPVSSPSFDAEGNVLLLTNGGLYMYSPALAPKGSTVMPRTPSQPHGALTGAVVFFPDDDTNGPFSYDTSSQKLTDFPGETAKYSSMVSVGNELVFARHDSSLNPPARLEAWDLAATSLWNVPLDNAGFDLRGIAVGADGTVYVPFGPTLYAIGN